MNCYSGGLVGVTQRRHRDRLRRRDRPVPQRPHRRGRQRDARDRPALRSDRAHLGRRACAGNRSRCRRRPTQPPTLPALPSGRPGPGPAPAIPTIDAFPPALWAAVLLRLRRPRCCSPSPGPDGSAHRSPNRCRCWCPAAETVTGRGRLYQRDPRPGGHLGRRCDRRRDRPDRPGAEPVPARRRSATWSGGADAATPPARRRVHRPGRPAYRRHRGQRTGDPLRRQPRTDDEAGRARSPRWTRSSTPCSAPTRPRRHHRSHPSHLTPQGGAP